jgi:O-antigen/teichoic acid export membrane protein
MSFDPQRTLLTDKVAQRQDQNQPAGPLKIAGALLGRNAALNLLGQLIPLLVGLVAIPYTIRGLGTVKFGVYIVAVTLLYYSNLFDLGLARATNKFVAEYLGRGEAHQLSTFLSVALSSEVVAGLGGLVLAASLVPILTGRILKIPTAEISEATKAFWILLLALPLVLAAGIFRSVLEAAQRFELINSISVPAAILNFLIPLIGLWAGFGLPGIMVLLVLAALAVMLAYRALCYRIFPDLRLSLSFDRRIVRRLLGFGLWVAVSNTLSPLLDYLDRFLVGVLISVSDVTYYAAPRFVVRKLLMFPESLLATLFPAFSSLDAGGASRRLQEIYARSLKTILLVLGSAVALIVVFAPQILAVWLGGDFSGKSSAVLRIAALGALVNGLAFVPYNALHALGRPDLTAKFHVAELPCYLAGLWVLAGRMGITGVALAWALRAAVDALLVFGASYILRPDSLRGYAEAGFHKGLVGITVFAALLGLVPLASARLGPQLLLAGMLSTLFALAVWRWILDDTDRAFLTLITARLASSLARKREMESL